MSIQDLYNIAALPLNKLEDLAIRKLSPDMKRKIYASYVFGIYSRHYLRYKFLSCKLQHKFNILPPEFTVHWLTTYNCNFRCAHCEAGAGDKIVSEMSTDEMCNIISELSNMGIKHIFFSGGETLIRKDMFGIIRFVLDKGMKYSIASNSYLVENFHKEFEEMKPYIYFTSIDGLEQTNDEIRRRPGAFKRCFQALEFFKSIDVNARVINTVVLPDNIGQLPELRKIIMNSAATSWRLAIPNAIGRAKNNENMRLSDEQIKYLFDFVEDTKKEFNVEISEDAGYLGCLSMKLRSVPFFCEAGLTRCSIMPDGEVYGCQIAYDNGLSEGNIRNNSFKEIWETGFSRFRNPQLDKEECATCEHFDCCRGGCWGMRLSDNHCYKRIWEAKC